MAASEPSPPSSGRGTCRAAGSQFPGQWSSHYLHRPWVGADPDAISSTSRSTPFTQPLVSALGPPCRLLHLPWGKEPKWGCPCVARFLSPWVDTPDRLILARNQIISKSAHGPDQPQTHPGPGHCGIMELSH